MDGAAGPRSKVHRHAERGRYDRDTVYSILDQALECHVAFVRDGEPFVLPTIHAREGDVLFLHGAAASAMLETIGGARAVCISVAIVDGLVLARSIFNQSVNYRSAVVFGQAETVTDPHAKLRALKGISERLLPGRWQDALQPTDEELRSTRVVQVKIAEASAKIRVGPPAVNERQPDRLIWSGVVPLHVAVGEPVPAFDAGTEIPVPGYMRHWQQNPGGRG